VDGIITVLVPAALLLVATISFVFLVQKLCMPCDNWKIKAWLSVAVFVSFVVTGVWTMTNLINSKEIHVYHASP